MNHRIVIKYLGRATLVSSVLFLVPALVAVIYQEYRNALICVAIAFAVALIALPFTFVKEKQKQMFAREGLVITALMWTLVPILGALPLYFTGEIPHFTDAIFESVSGYTTTGATICSDVEALSMSMNFWRCFTHWIGGMGVLVLMIAIVPSSSSDALNLMRAECAGPQVGKITPKGKDSAKALYLIYTALSVVLVVLLLLGGMPLYDSLCHAMATAGTGGFFIKNDGLAGYDSVYIEMVISAGMILFGINFSLYYYLTIKRYKEVMKNAEWKVYLSIISISTLVIILNAKTSFRYSIFQVASIMTSTGFSTADYCQWPALSQMILVMLMFVGACGGSTGGGFKVSRFIIMFKSAVKYIRKMLHPRSVNVVKDSDQAMDIETIHGVQYYLILYLGLFIVSLLLVSANNADFSTTFSAVTACINNIGPGISKVGPTENYAFFSDFSKIVLSLDMLLGRLECIPIIVLLSPSTWRTRF